MVELVRGKDRKLYPAGLPRPLAERKRLRALAHDMRCRQHLSFRAVQAAMLAQGIRRSRGQIFKDVKGWRCPYCLPKPPAPPDPRQKARPVAWR